MSDLRRKRHWLARPILWSGITERQTCCVLCHCTMTVVASLFALGASRDWAAARSMMAAGVALDVIRTVVDLCLGRPNAARLRDAYAWTGDTWFMAIQKWSAYSVLFLFWIAVPIGWTWFSIVLSAANPPYRLLLRAAESLPDLSQSIRSVPVSEVSGRSVPDIVVIQAFVSVAVTFTAGSTLLALIFVPRQLSLIHSEWARQQGSKTFSDHTVLVPGYLFFIFIELLAVFFANRLDNFACIPGEAHCFLDKDFAMYVRFLSYVGLIAILITSLAESGCLERPAPLERNGRTGSVPSHAGLT